MWSEQKRRTGIVVGERLISISSTSNCNNSPNNNNNNSENIK
ncbi:hypothetical protein PP707_07810 [Acetobacter pasteurianus]|nr:hypothetical protein [Acetobacter pasteurianus]